MPAAAPRDEQEERGDGAARSRSSSGSTRKTMVPWSKNVPNVTDSCIWDVSEMSQKWDVYSPVYGTFCDVFRCHRPEVNLVLGFFL